MKSISKMLILITLLILLNLILIAGECDNYSGSYIYTENIPSGETDGCDWKNLDARDPIQNLETLNGHYGYWGCDDSSTQVFYCLLTNCDGTGGSCGTNTGACSTGTNTCSTSGLYCAGAVGPTTETLNSVDDDCDGIVDNVPNLKNLEYSPKSWYTASPSFITRESEKNCSSSSDNTDDGWSAPQGVCYLDSSYTACSNGCSGNYLVARQNVSITEPVSQLSSVKLKVYFTPRGPAHAGKTANVGIRVGTVGYSENFYVTSSSPRIIDLSSKKNWTWNDLKNSVTFLKLNDGINFNVDQIKLQIRGYGCAGTETVCDGIDDDCDGQTDEGVKTTYFRDSDGDGYGSILSSTNSCSTPSGYALNADDCDDTSLNVKPTATENTSNGIDDDCDGLTDEGKIKTGICNSSKPSNSEYNYGSAIGTYTQTWDGDNTWNPTTLAYHYNSTAQECAWKCLSSHLYDSTTNTCSADLTPAVCTGSPSTNGIWNDGGQNGNYNYRTGEPSNLSANYNTTIGNCNWICGSSYHYNAGACVTNSSSLACDLTDINGSLPSNAKWNSSNTFTQTWNGSSWLPASKKAVYNEVPGECNYACKEPSKNCSPNPETYCGSGVQECVAGNWGNCVPTSATICSQNQYCNVDSCMFCSDGIKNCDSNLLNGCETNIQNDENNCGTCGTICETGQTCTSGICGGSGVIPTDPCENVTCGVNSNCNQGNCVCETGYNNCNGSNTDGCETNGSCNSGPQDECETNTDCETNELCELGNCVEKECETDDECSGTCVSNKCIDQVSKSCLVPEQCGTNQTCVDGYCATLTCGTGFIIKDQACDCEGNVCSGVCYFEEGICCKGTWKSGQSKCSSPIDLEYIEEIVLSSNDDEAIELLDNGKASLANGDTDKANAQFAVAELKAKLVLAGNPTEFAYDYAAAKTALTNGNYFTAESLAKETIGEIRPVSNYNWLITIIVIIIIVGAFIFFIYKKKNSVSIENEY